MIFCNNTTTFVNKNAAFYTQLINFVFQDPGVNKNPTADTEFCIFIHKTRGDHTDTIFLITDLNSVSGIRTYTTAGDDYRFILKSDMGNNLALPFIPKKSTNDNCTAHCLSCSIDRVPK